MAGDPDEMPAGDREREGRTAEDADRLMRGIRAARVRAMIARGEVPVGYRINDEGTGFIPIGNPAWPVRPLDRHCTQYGEPSLELLVLIRQVLPDFDPESDPRGWLDVGEVVRRTGRPAAEVEAMDHDDLVAFFRFDLLHSPAPQSPGGVDASAAKAQSGAVDTHRANVSHDVEGSVTPEPPRKETTRQMLRRMMSNDVDLLRLKNARTAEGVADLLGKAPSTVKGTHPEWDELMEKITADKLARGLAETLKSRRKS